MIFDSNQSQRLKLIRAVAVVMILITHISQEYKTSFMVYSNTGVQMFLVISGFIIAQRETINWRQWGLSRLLRIFPSYYIILFLTAVTYWLFLRINIVDIQFLSHFSTLHFLFFPNYPFWGGHLWYITAIVICYGIFPFLFISKRINSIKFLIIYIFLVPLFLFVLFYKSKMPYRLSGDIYCFILGFVGAKIFKQNIPNYLNVFFIFLSLIIFTGEYTSLQNNYWNISLLETLIQLLWPWKKCIYGTTICLILYSTIFDMISFNMVVNFIDKYSYEIYLSHKNFILGQLSLLYISKYSSLNVIIAMGSSILCALIVYNIATFVRRILEKHIDVSPNE